MPDRAPRLGDVIDDYCPRCRLLLNHDVTSLFANEVAKVTCRTCHNTLDYRHAQVPPRRKSAKKEDKKSLMEQVLVDVPLLVGILPLYSHKNAEFLHNEVPGMQIPSETRERMRRVQGGEAARKEGVKIAREMLFAVRDRVQGAYLMPPLGRYELALEVLDGLKR